MPRRASGNLIELTIDEEVAFELLTCTEYIGVFIMVSKGRSGWDNYRLLRMRKGSIKNGCRHDRFAVHY